MDTKTTAMKNIENIQKVIDIITENPSCWNQREWHCGTSHCFAGHGQIQLRGYEDTRTTRRDARIYFGFTFAEANYFFHAFRTLAELTLAVNDSYDESGYNPDGYDRQGFDKDGYDRYYYSKDGAFHSQIRQYDEDGLDQNNNPFPSK